MIGVGEIGERFVHYFEIAAVRVDSEGALRIFRRRRWFGLRQDVFHPPGEWNAVTLRRGGECNVELRSLEDLQREMNELREQRRDAARLMRLDGWPEI